MAPRRQNPDEPSRPRRKRRMPPPGTEEYKEKRDRNNEAVRKSREKTREKAKKTVDRVSLLREENQMLEQQVEILSKELNILKDLFKIMHGDGKDPANSADISVQTKNDTELTEATESSVIVIKPDTSIMELNELNQVNENVANVAPTIIDIKSATEALQADHQYIKMNN